MKSSFLFNVVIAPLVWTLSLNPGTSNCGITITKATAYSMVNNFKVDFKNDSKKPVSAVEFRIEVLDSFDEVQGTQTELWEADIDPVIQPGKSEFILRTVKMKNMSRIRARVIRVRYDNGEKCYE